MNRIESVIIFGFTLAFSPFAFLIASPLNCGAENFDAQQPTQQGNVWRCRSGESDRITITDAPSRIAGQTGKSGCEIIDLSASSFLRLPADRFHALGMTHAPEINLKRGINLELGINRDGVDTADIAAVENGHPEPETGRIKLSRVTGTKPITSFNAKNISASSRKGRHGLDRHPFNQMCEISGVARSEESADAVIRIRRGALTIDDVPIKLSGNGKPVKWRTTLSGVCRNPEVTVVAE